LEVTMRGLLGDLDDLLRGKKSDPEVLAGGTGHLAVRRSFVYVVVLGAVYGLAMGLYASMTREPGTSEQLLSSAMKVPLLFLLSLVVTLPSFVVFSALLGVKLSPREAVRVIVAAILVNVAVLASFAPILAFFTICTTSYPFLKMLNVLFFVVAGGIGVGFFRKLVASLEKAHVPEREGVPQSPTPEERLTSRRLLRIWVVIYVLVAGQMAWVLRPLIGTPDEPFVWFKFDDRGGSFLLDLSETVKALFGG
jgi:hypothetical protein